MANTSELEKAIKKSGKMKGYLADRLGITRTSFYYKCRNRGSFTADEAILLSDEIGVGTMSEFRKIFLN